MKYSRRSAMVAPGTTPTPPVTTRVGIPSVCESTALRYLLNRILSASQMLHSPLHVQLEGGQLLRR